MPAPPLATPLRVAVGVALLTLVGLLAVAAARALVERSGRGRGVRLRDGVEHLALAWAAGQAVAVPLLVCAGLAGLPLRGRPIALLLAGVAAATGGVAAVARRRRRRLPGTATPKADSSAAVGPGAAAGGDRTSDPAAAAHPAAPDAPAALLWAGRLVLTATLLLAVLKLALVPLWSWDHFAIWGLKARLFAAGGTLDLQILHAVDLVDSVPDYPLGVPLAWLAATLGALPNETLVRGFHVGWLLALVALVHAAARRLSASPLVALAAASFVAASPLAWDSVHLGLADLPLALFAVAAVAAAAAAVGSAAGGCEAPSLAAPRSMAAADSSAAQPGCWALAGLFVGFLPWVKSEGASLAALLALALAAWRWRTGGRERWRDMAALAVPAALVGGVAVAIGALLPKGRSFFDGDLAGRLARRLAAPWDEVLAPIFAELAGREWLGLWAALLVVLAVAMARRRVPALLLAAVVVLQLATYTAVFFATYLPVADHVESALHRIAAALLPLAVLAVAALAARRPPDIRPPGTRSAGTRSARRIPT